MLTTFPSAGIRARCLATLVTGMLLTPGACGIALFPDTADYRGKRLTLVSVRLLAPAPQGLTIRAELVSLLLMQDDGAAVIVNTEPLDLPTRDVVEVTNDLALPLNASFRGVGFEIDNASVMASGEGARPIAAGVYEMDATLTLGEQRSAGIDIELNLGASFTGDANGDTAFVPNGTAKLRATASARNSDAAQP